MIAAPPLTVRPPRGPCFTDACLNEVQFIGPDCGADYCRLPLNEAAGSGETQPEGKT